MKRTIQTAVALVAVAFTYSIQAAKPAPAAPAPPAPAEGEEVTLKGTMCCAKCALKEAEECADVVQVGETKYYLEEDGKAKTSVHQCRGTAPVKVTGTVETREGKKFIVVSAIEKKEKKKKGE